MSVSLSSITFTLDGEGARIAFADALAGWDTRWHFQITRVGDRHLMAVAVPVPDQALPTIDIVPFDWTLLDTQ